MSRRIKQFSISWDALAEMFKKTTPLKSITYDGMPDDAICVGAILGRGRRVTLYIESASFPVVPGDDLYTPFEITRTETLWPEPIQQQMIEYLQARDT